MTGITCKGCGAHVTVRGLDQCPICRIPIEPIIAGYSPQHTMPASSRTTSQPNIAFNPKYIAAGIVVVLIGMTVLFITKQALYPSPERVRSKKIGVALASCQAAIKSLAQYGGADTPPYVQNYSRANDDEFYFAWPNGSFEFPNGFGAKKKMSASCTGTLSSGEIKHITLNGVDIL